MHARHIADRRLFDLSLEALALVSLVLTSCSSPAEQRQANLRHDGGTCSSFGAGDGSPQHAECMLAQQRRRDDQVTDAREAARVASEVARNNQEMADGRDRD